MKNRILVLFVLIIGLAACETAKKKDTPTEDTVKAEYTIETAQNYAELSVAQGGTWQDGTKGHMEYLGGTSFENVESLKVPEQHTDHTWFIRYEGPGWESNKIGYRVYLDWRNAIDIFGKKTDAMVLPQVGQDGFDSYHEMADWGLDILKAGKGLGIGSIGRFNNGEVLHFNEVDSTFAKVENTIDYSAVHINYNGWKTAEDKIDLAQELSIKPNVRYTKHSITPSAALEGICTGIVKHGVNYFNKQDENSSWGYIATYGKQTLVEEPDNLGMAVFYKVSTVEEVTEWEHDHLVVFKPTTEKVTFYFLGAWEQEKDGIKTETEFLDYLDTLLKELNENDKL